MDKISQSHSQKKMSRFLWFTVCIMLAKPWRRLFLAAFELLWTNLVVVAVLCDNVGIRYIVAFLCDRLL